MLFSASIEEVVQNLLFLRETPDLLLGKYQLTVNFDVKNTTTATDEFGLDAGFLGNPGRQTGGLWQIVSLAAVRD